MSFVYIITGGLLISLPHDKAEGYCREIEALERQPAWIIGEVVPGARQARLAEELKILEVQ